MLFSFFPLTKGTFLIIGFKVFVWTFASQMPNPLLPWATTTATAVAHATVSLKTTHLIYQTTPICAPTFAPYSWILRLAAPAPVVAPLASHCTGLSLVRAACWATLLSGVIVFSLSFSFCCFVARNLLVVCQIRSIK